MWRWADLREDVREDVKMSRCEDEQMWEKMWRWADERRQMWEKMWRWADVKMSRCERRCEDEKMWRWADVREDVKMSRCERRCEDEQMREDRCERRCEDEQMWRWADVREDVKMSRCEDEQMWEKMWRWADVKMSRCERRCEDEQMWRWADVREDVKMSRCEDEQMWEKMWRWADVKEKCEDEKMLRRCEDEKMFYRPPLLEEPCAQTLSGKMHCKQNCLRCGLAFQKEPAETWNYQTCKRQQNIMHPTVPLCSNAVALAACRCAQHEPCNSSEVKKIWPKRKVRQCTWTKRFIVPQSRPLQSSCQTRINHHVIEIPKNGYLASPKLTVLKWTISVVNPSLIMVRNHSIPWPRHTFHHTMRCL